MNLSALGFNRRDWTLSVELLLPGGQGAGLAGQLGAGEAELVQKLRPLGFNRTLTQEIAAQVINVTVDIEGVMGSGQAANFTGANLTVNLDGGGSVGGVAAFGVTGEDVPPNPHTAFFRCGIRAREAFFD